jgi:acetyl esterase
MTCVIALKLRDENGPPSPSTCRCPPKRRFPPTRWPPARTAPVPTWSPTGSSRRSGTWSSTDDVRRPYLTPLNAESQAGLPPAILVTKGFDPLRDVGHAYAQKLAAAGNDLTYIHNPDLTHGFPQFTGTQPPATKRRSSWPTTSRPRSADPTVTWHRPATEPHE